MYTIKKCKEERLTAYVDQYPWGCAYQPKTSFSMYMDKGKGFFLEMTCNESNPKAVFLNDDDPVYKDSSLEFFVDFYPEDQTSGYLNFEMNANGALLLHYGHDKYTRTSVNHLLVDKPQVTKDTLSWTVELKVPLTFIHAIYGRSDFVSGQYLSGNFYKCGDETKSKHYGCWNFINFHKPNFHVPSYFGPIVIE